MDNVVVGNLCQDPVLRQPTRGSRPFAKFTLAVNAWRRVGQEFVERPPVFHRVVCFGQLAENVSNSLRKGMEVVAVGEWADDSYSDEQGQRKIQITMEARTVGPTLRWATAQVVRTERRPDPESPPQPAPTIPLDLRATPPDEPDLTPVNAPFESLTPDQLRTAAAEMGAELISATSIPRSLRNRKKPTREPATTNAT